MNERRQNLFMLALLALSLLLITLGLLQQQPLRVMQKAVRVCLECIGIG